jgi:dipeptidyl aminopeptidase/acylaminoacyl peptidase
VLSRTWAGLVCAFVATLWVATPPAAIAADPPRVEAYGMLPSMEAAKLSPDGTMLAFLTSAQGHRCVVVHFLETQKDPVAHCPGNMEIRWFAWKTNSRLLFGVYESVPFGPRLITASYLLGVNVDGSNEKELLSPRQGRMTNFSTDNVVDFLASDPSHVMVTVDSSGYYPDVIAVDINTGERSTVIDSTQHIMRWLTDTQGRPRMGYTVMDHKTIYLYRPESSSDFVKLEGTDIIGDTGFLPLAFSDKPNIIYVSSKRETGRRCIYLYDAENKKIVDRYACKDNTDIDGLLFKNKHVVGYIYADDQPHQVFTEQGWKQDSEAIARKFPNDNVTLLDRTADGHRELVKVTEPGRPATIYVLDRVPGQKTTLYPVGDERPYIPQDSIAPVKSITYRARDGLQIHGYLTMPLGEANGPIPFVVLPHGGPYARDYLGFDYLAQMIASRGYGVLQPNFRGSTGYGDDFLLAGFREWGRKMQDDVTDATKWLIDQKLADPARICIVGWSYGGYAALMGAIREPSLYKCAASMAGPTDLRHIQPISGVSQSMVAVPILNGDKSLIDQSSPAKNADKITIPILLAHGQQDVNVSISDSTEMEKALKDAGKQVDTIYFPGDDHFLFREGDRIAFLKKLDEFLRTNLGPSPVH